MCLQCHSKLSKDKIIDMLKNESHENFKNWNLTSLSHVIISASGDDGDEAKQLALDLFKNFIEWAKTYEDYTVNFNPSFFGDMPSLAQLEEAYNFLTDPEAS